MKNIFSCSADGNIISDVIYSDYKLMAFAHVKVFKFFDSERLSFHCKLTLCTKKADGCEGIIVISFVSLLKKSFYRYGEMSLS